MYLYSMSKLQITDRELNRAYEKLNEADKSRMDITVPYILWVNDKELQFVFDPSIGRHGAWILSTDVDVEFTEEEEEDYQADFDYQL